MLFARITPCLENGKMAIADTEGQNGIGSTELFVFRGIDGVSDTDYVYYLLCMKHIRQLAANSMTGASGRQRADLDFIKRIQWDFPDIEMQKKIASVLSAYDNLIEVNNKRIDFLEQIAENLYKEWFVRFRFPGHETAEFENGIPEGWAYRRADEVIDFNPTLDTIIPGNKDADINNDRGVNTTPDTLPISKAISLSFAKMYAPVSLMQFCDTFILPNVNDLFSSKDTIPYSLQRFTEAVEFAVLYEGSINSSRIYEYTSTLITRLKHLSESEQGDFFDKTSFSSIDDYIRDIIGVSQLLNIDISNLDDTATEVVTKVFSKMLFDYLRALSPRNSMPINLILEEAHRFVRSDMDYGVLGYNIFERIAKEGRKFGLLMGISSQRPSELSKTVVSQCNNFIIHKIQNPDDIQYISRMVPYMNQGMVDRITYLRRGYALVFGTAINLPTLTAFEKASPSPNSGNSNIVEKWYVD